MARHKDRKPVVIEREGKRIRIHLATIRVNEYPRMTQEEFADFIGIGKTTLSRIENGHMLPGMPIALSICRRLKKPVEEVFELLPE